jgi:hypothetical protein
MASKHSPFPTLHPVGDEVVDPGTVRLGDRMVSDEFPTLHQSDEDVTDTGTVRLGDGMISDEFPTE